MTKTKLSFGLLHGDVTLTKPRTSMNRKVYPEFLNNAQSWKSSTQKVLVLLMTTELYAATLRGQVKLFEFRPMQSMGTI